MQPQRTWGYEPGVPPSWHKGQGEPADLKFFSPRELSNQTPSKDFFNTDYTGECPDALSLKAKASGPSRTDWRVSLCEWQFEAPNPSPVRTAKRQEGSYRDNIITKLHLAFSCLDWEAFAGKPGSLISRGRVFSPQITRVRTLTPLSLKAKNA